MNLIATQSSVQQLNFFVEDSHVSKRISCVTERMIVVTMRMNSYVRIILPRDYVEWVTSISALLENSPLYFEGKKGKNELARNLTISWDIDA